MLCYYEPGGFFNRLYQLLILHTVYMDSKGICRLTNEPQRIQIVETLLLCILLKFIYFLSECLKKRLLKLLRIKLEAEADALNGRPMKIVELVWLQRLLDHIPVDLLERVGNATRVRRASREVGGSSPFGVAPSPKNH